MGVEDVEAVRGASDECLNRVCVSLDDFRSEVLDESSTLRNLMQENVALSAAEKEATTVEMKAMNADLDERVNQMVARFAEHRSTMLDEISAVNKAIVAHAAAVSEKAS